MARRRRESPSESLADNIFDLLTITPLWVGPALAVVAFLFLRLLLPLFIPTPKSGGVDINVLWRPMLALVWWGIPGFILMLWAGAELRKLLKRILPDNPTRLQRLPAMSWQEFEHIIADAYRRQGYHASVVGSEMGDGGVDIELTRPGEKVLVQCKHWKAYKVSVKILRELLGVVTSQRAMKGIIVTTGQFTQDAKVFARANPQIELVNGPQLDALLGDLPGAPAPTPRPAPLPQSPRCPLCGAEMALRTARRGDNPGSRFWGCPQYPECRGTRPRMAP